MKKISFVIPCYRSENTVSTVIDGILEKMSERTYYDYEIIAVNDCSPDNVITVLKDIAQSNTKVKVVDLAINVGKHGAVLAGYREVTGDYVVNVDDDGQCPIEGLWEMIQPLEAGHDMSMAKYEKKKESFIKRIGSKANSFMSVAFLGKPKEMVFTSFVARQRYIADAMASYTNVFPYLEGLSLRVTHDVVLIPLDEHSRISGKSGYTLRKSLKLWANGFTSFSGKPLKISYYVGAAFFIIGIICLILSIISKSANNIVAFGVLFPISVVFIVGAFIMFALGLLGEYIGRIMIGVNHYPQSVVKERINIE